MQRRVTAGTQLLRNEDVPFVQRALSYDSVVDAGKGALAVTLPARAPTRPSCATRRRVVAPPGAPPFNASRRDRRRARRRQPARAPRRRGEWRKPAERALGRRYGIEIVSPGSADEASALVRDRMAAEQRPAVVVAAGGDGTVRLVAQELAGTGVPLGVLPLGTGNDFAKANGIPDDVAGALERIVRRSTRAIDLLEVNGRPFVTAGGIGIGAYSALAVPWIKALHPSPASPPIRSATAYTASRPAST